MRSAQFNRVLKLVRHTGDRFVIMDNESDEVFVLMNLREYENNLDLVSDWEGLDEEELNNRAGEDYTRWKQNNFNSRDLNESGLISKDNDSNTDFFTDDFKSEEIPEDLHEDFITEEKKDFSNPTVAGEPRYVPNIATESDLNTIVAEPSKEYPLNTATEDIGEIGEEENEPKFYLEPIV